MKYNYWLIFGRQRREGIENTELEDRLRLSIQLLNKGLIDKVVLSWWISHYFEWVNKISDAENMKSFLLLYWVTEDKIILETKSKETIWNILFSLELLDDIENLYLITNDHELPRIALYCSYLGAIDFRYNLIWVHSSIKITTPTWIDRDLLVQRSLLYTKTVFDGCYDISSFKVRLLSHYFAYNPNSPLTKEIVQAYHKGEIEIEEIEKILEKIKK